METMARSFLVFIAKKKENHFFQLLRYQLRKHFSLIVKRFLEIFVSLIGFPDEKQIR